MGAGPLEGEGQVAVLRLNVPVEEGRPPTSLLLDVGKSGQLNLASQMWGWKTHGWRSGCDRWDGDRAAAGGLGYRGRLRVAQWGGTGLVLEA